MLIGVILPPNHPWRSQASEIGTITFDGRPAGLTAATRTPQDLMLVDLVMLQPADVLDIRRYRTIRGKTRIVVSYPVETKPGNPILATLISLGIWDLVSDDTPLDQALARTPEYGDVAQWHSPMEMDGAVRKWPLGWNRGQNQTGKQTKKEQVKVSPSLAPEPVPKPEEELQGLNVIIDEVYQPQRLPANLPAPASEWWNGLNETERTTWRKNVIHNLATELHIIIPMPS